MLTRLSIKYLCGLAFLVSSGFVSSNTQFTYNTVDDGIVVTGCVGECPTDLVIPEEIDGYPVTIIGGAAFGEKNLSSVLIPDINSIYRPLGFCKQSIIHRNSSGYCYFN